VSPATGHPHALGPDQLDAYRDQGFVVLRGQLPAGVLAAVARAFATAVDRLARSWHAAGLVTDVAEGAPDHDARLDALRAQHDEPVPQTWRKLLVTPELHAVWGRPELLGPIRSLVGDEVWAHGIWNGRPRIPGEHRNQVLWHQDAHYYRGWDPADGRLVSAWMPLVPVDRPRSCLELVPGSHRWGRVERVRSDTGLFTVPDAVLERAGAEPGVAADMAPGDVLLFADTTLHQSTRNVSDRTRWSLDVRFAEATPGLLAKDVRGYRCHSAADPASVETYETWAARYDYHPTELVDELENFAGIDPDRARGWLTDLPDRLDVY
jgi:hypothetical protein